MIAVLLRREPAIQAIHDYLWFVNQRYRVGTSVVFGRVAKLQSSRTGERGNWRNSTIKTG